MNFKSIETAENHKLMAKEYFRCKKTNQWQENGCSSCGKGMTKRIYDFQLSNGLKPVCLGCEKRLFKKLTKQ